MEISKCLESPYPKSVRRGILRAIEASLDSDCPNFKVGAVLVKNSNIIGVGHNIFKKTAPDSFSRNKGIHAEFQCIRNASRVRSQARDFSKLAGSTLYVARTTVGLRVAMSMPCEYCQEFLKLLDLHKIYYTDRDGGISEMVLS